MKEFGHFSGYPEDIHKNKRVQKLFEEFDDKYSPVKTPFSDDEPDPNAGRGLNREIPPEEVLYGKRIDYLQEDPIGMEEHPAGLRNLEEEFKKSGGPTL